MDLPCPTHPLGFPRTLAIARTICFPPLCPRAAAHLLREWGDCGRRPSRKLSDFWNSGHGYRASDTDLSCRLELPELCREGGWRTIALKFRTSSMIIRRMPSMLSSSSNEKSTDMAHMSIVSLVNTGPFNFGPGRTLFWAYGLVCRIVPNAQPWVVQGFVTRNSFARIEGEKL